ncbi:MAG: amidohydrolase [Chloroflexi bacterium]|nr:amidohydrolase [Chloroflexota bacterium]
MRTYRILITALLFLGILVTVASLAWPQKADLVLTHANIYTVDKNHPIAQAMAVRGNTIVYVGDTAGVQKWIGPRTRVADLGGKLVLPGFIDSHAHAASGVSELFEVPLYGLDTVEKYQQVLRDFVTKTPGLSALQGVGWINSVFGEHGPTSAMLDEAILDIPVVLYSQDYHSVWANSLAVKQAGINAATPDPQGGVIERDEKGNPLGTFRESAVSLVAGVIPPYSSSQIAQGLIYFQDYAHSLGITSVYIPSFPNGEENGLAALHDLEASGKMTLRFPTAMAINPQDDLTIVDRILSRQKVEAGGYFEIAGAKIFMDGVLEGLTAYLEQPYTFKPESRGELLWDPQKYNSFCAALDKTGLQVTVHSIGDAATRISLDGFNYARQQNGKRDARNMITHLQLVNENDIARFADLNVIAVPQPYWHVVDIYFQQTLTLPMSKDRGFSSSLMSNFGLCHKLYSVLKTGDTLNG